jgi:myo-inositol-1(or 4)-monophosphatase
MERSAAMVDIAELGAFALETIKTMGQQAMQFYGKGRGRPPFDQDLVTQAELHLEDAFQECVKQRYPDHHIFGQDAVGEGYSHAGKRYLWTFDPLDGVDNFQTGIPIWGMSLALYENHWPVLGLFYMPATGDLFRAAAGQEAFWNDSPIRMADRGDLDQESLVLTFSRFHQAYQMRFPGKIRALGSTGAHACYVAMGRADVAFMAHESFQDLAAVRVIVEAAGGKLFKIDGSPFFLGDYIDGQKIEEPVMITAPSSTSSVLECLRRI